MVNGNIIKFNDWTDASEAISKTLKLRGAESAAVYINDSKKVEIAVVGKCGSGIKDLVSLAKGESIADYEGIDDTTKKTGYVIPIEKASKMLIDCLGFEGRFLVVPAEEQDETSTEVTTEILYVPKEDGYSNDSQADVICELIESACYLVDPGDAAEDIAQNLFEVLRNIASRLGNTTLAGEVQDKIIDFEV